MLRYSNFTWPDSSLSNLCIIIAECGIIKTHQRTTKVALQPRFSRARPFVLLRKLGKSNCGEPVVGVGFN